MSKTENQNSTAVLRYKPLYGCDVVQQAEDTGGTKASSGLCLQPADSMSWLHHSHTKVYTTGVHGNGNPMKMEIAFGLLMRMGIMSLKWHICKKYRFAQQHAVTDEQQTQFTDRWLNNDTWYICTHFSAFKYSKYSNRWQ